MPSDTAELVISCKAEGTANVNKFTDAVRQADGASNQLVKTLGGLFSTAAILSFAKTSINAYSDLQEATQKFYEVFKGLEQEAGKEAKILEERFGASERSAKSMLSLTGDLLTGFGFSRDEALKLSAQVAQLGSDIASFSNYAGGAEGATQAITKAMLGETEMAKMLGIAIKTDSQEYKDLYKQIKETRGTTDSQTKALAALQIAFQQKGTAMGDFERNITSIANRGRLLSNQMENLRVNIGKVFAEDYSAGQQMFVDLLKSFNNLAEPQRNFIVKTGAITAALIAAKTAAGAYSLFSGMAAKNTAANAVSINQEAAAHRENAAAIVAENAAKNSSERSISVRNALTARKLMLDAQEAASADAKALRIAKAEMKIVAAQNERVKYQLALAGQKYSDIPEYTAAVKKIQQLTMAYNQSAVAASNAAKAYNAARNAAVATGAPIVAQKAKQSMVALGTSIDVVNAHTMRTNKSLVVMGSAAVLGKLRIGITGLTTALRGASVAALGLAKAFLPMLVISGAIAGIDYLINRNKRAADARNEYAESVVASARAEAEAEEKRRIAANGLVESLKLMSEYSSMTNDEQAKARDTIRSINTDYEGFADKIKIVNGRLVVAADAWKSLTDAQRQNYIMQEQKKAKFAMDAANAMIQGAGTKFGSIWNTLHKGFDKENSEKYDLIQMMKQGGTAEFYKMIANSATKRGLFDMAEYASRIAAYLEEANKANKNIAEVNKKNFAGGKGGINETTEQLKNFKKTLDKLKEKRHSDLFEGFTDQQKLDDIAKRYAEINKNYKEALERGKGNREEQTKALQYAGQLVDLEKQRAEIMQDAEQQRADALERAAEQERSFYNQMLQIATSFRETAQTGIEANSVEGLRLQSRRMSGGEGLQAAAKMTAEATKQAAEAAKQANKILEDMKQKQKEIYDQLSKIGISEL